MYQLAMDQARQESIPAQHTLQVHMHHLCCPCSNIVYPYYHPSYRTPILAQPPPIPRPSYLHHYQYTQLHLNPSYNVPLAPLLPQPLPQNVSHSAASAVDLAFGPPPRDRRNFDNQDYDEQRVVPDKNKNDNRNNILQYVSLTADAAYGIAAQYSSVNYADLTASQVAALSIENYIAYLVNGCITGERIAKRNEHRPCFKNIQNLCNRTRSEVVKPNITVSNIHSQGMPWATKDFIFAFVRAINCWCILRGYLGCKDGNLGKIDREISPEFRSCYIKWEKCTKQLTHHLIQTFCKLDEANSPVPLTSLNTQMQQPIPSPSSSTCLISTPLLKMKTFAAPQELPNKIISETTPQRPEKTLNNKELSSLKGIPGILHIPSTSTAEVGEANNQTSESTEVTTRGEESDPGKRVYMKPGSYKVPKRKGTKQSNAKNSRSVELVEGAQNSEGVKKELTTSKSESLISELLRDKVWQAAQNITPEFIKQNEESHDAVSIASQNKSIESWLNNEKNRFDCQELDGEEDDLQAVEDMLSSLSAGKPARSNDPSTAHCNSAATNDGDPPLRTYRKRPDFELRPLVKPYPSFRRSPASSWEYKSTAIMDSLSLLNRLFWELERDQFISHIPVKSTYSHSDEDEMKNPTELAAIYKKYKNHKYTSLNEVVHDFRHIFYVAGDCLKDGHTLATMTLFRDRFEDLLDQVFPHLDFTHISGKADEVLGPLVSRASAKLRRNTEGDGDH